MHKSNFAANTNLPPPSGPAYVQATSYTPVKSLQYPTVLLYYVVRLSHAFQPRLHSTAFQIYALQPWLKPGVAKPHYGTASLQLPVNSVHLISSPYRRSFPALPSFPHFRRRISVQLRPRPCHGPHAPLSTCAL